MAKTVFLDTQVFDTHLFDFDSPLLENFRSFASTGLINVVTTEVTRGEIEARITEKVQESLQSLNEWLKERDTRILRHLGDRYEVLFSKPKPEELIAVLKKQFQEFLDATHTTIIPTGSLDGAKLVSEYFGSIAPFGPGRKKEQFPDAIAVSVLRQWCEDNNCTVEVVSGDGDWKRACDGCKWLTHTAELKDLLSGLGIVPQEVTEAIVKEVLENRGLPGVIATRFKDLYFFTPNEQGTVTSLEDVEVRIDGYSFVTAPEGPSTIEAICHVSFTAKVEYELGPDDDRATGDWSIFDTDTLTFRDSVKQSVVRTVQVSIEHDSKNASSVQITNVDFEKTDVEVKWRGPSAFGN